MLRSHRCYCILCMALALLLAALALLLDTSAAQAQAPGKPVSFINDVAPILKENCFACHDARKRKGKLDLTTVESLHKGGTREEDPVVAGKPEESYLLDVLVATNASRMPPKDSGEALPPAKIALVRQWIKEGAKLDQGITPKSDLVKELRARWQPPTPPPIYPGSVSITALAFTPDNKQLVVGGHHELTVWDVATAKLEKRVRTRSERTYAMVFLPDGKLVVAGGRPGQEGDVVIYDLQGGKPKVENGVAYLDGVADKSVRLKQLLENDDSVLCLGLSADGKHLASGGCDRLINVWDLSGGYTQAKLVQTFENHADWVMGVALTNDGRYVVSASRDKTAKVWDLKTKESVVTFPAHQNNVYGVVVKPDGKVAYSVGEDNQVRSFNPTGDGKPLKALGGHGKSVQKIAYNPKQPMLATCSADGTVRLWNAESGAALKTLSGHTDWVYSVAFSPDGTLVAAGSFNGAVRIWKVADGSPVKAFNASPGLKLADSK